MAFEATTSTIPSLSHDLTSFLRGHLEDKCKKTDQAKRLIFKDRLQEDPPRYDD